MATQYKANELRKNGYKFFKLKADSNAVYVLNHYDRATKSYSISPDYDINAERFIKATRTVFVGFTY